MREGFEYLSQEQQDGLAGKDRVKKRERDETQKQSATTEIGKLKDIIQNILSKERGSKFLHEKADQLYSIARRILEKSREKKPAEVEIIDENDPQNILSDKSRNIDLSFQFGGLPYSTEGFAENPSRQAELARFLIKKFNLQNRGPLLDVGFGANIHVANAFANEKMEAHAIDEQQHDHATGEPMWHAPRAVRVNEEGVNILSGDIADLDSEDSAIGNKKFGLILFNGSWAAGGNNWTVAGETMEGKYHNRPDKTESLVEFMDHEKEIILQSCKKHLTNNGLIGVVSSRYAFHGAGYDYSQLPDEKLSFVDVYDRFSRLGAKKIYLLGITQEGFDEMLKRSVEQRQTERNQLLSRELSQEKIASVREQLRDVSGLPREDTYSEYGDNPKYQKDRINGVIEATKNIPQLNRLARIDAIFA